MLSKYVNLFLIPDMVLERHTDLMRRYEGCAIFFHLQPSEFSWRVATIVLSQLNPLTINP